MNLHITDKMLLSPPGSPYKVVPHYKEKENTTIHERIPAEDSEMRNDISADNENER
jgi:hypothetical protein